MKKTGVGGSPASRRLFLALGTIVAAVLAFRLLRAASSAVALLGARAASSATAGPSPWQFVGAHAGPLLLAGLVLAGVVIAILAGAVARRPWARPAAIALFSVVGVTGLAVALFQLSGVLRGSGTASEAAEIGYGPILTFWRVAGGAAALLVALFCAAAIRRFASEEMRRQFSGRARRP